MKLFRRFTALMLAVTLSLTTFAAAARDWAAVEVADKAGATVKGIVYAGDEPLRGVAVSDGAEIVFTDAEGRYWLPTDKRSGSVFITIPSGYEVSADGVFPRFWAALEAPAKEVERHDFALTKVDNDRHVMLAVTDIHLSNQNSDIEQFCTRFIPDVRAVAESFGIEGVAAAMKGELTPLKFIGALLISLTMNTTFAPVFMTLHKITDTHILNNGGSLRALVRPIPMRRIISSLNWEVQWGFVFKKTIPFFWIPAHTITFLLAPQYQVLFAALLGVMLGILLSVAAVAGRK